LPATRATADQYHYANVLLGARAQGLAGAFTALADDASGVSYNPGGTAFARGGDLSLSSATFYQRRTTYARVFGESDFDEKARGAVSSFLGGLTRLGGKAPLEGLTLGFAFSTPDAGLVDENSTLLYEPRANLLRYRRTQSTRATTLHASTSAAVGLGSHAGLGISVGYFDVDELSIIQQSVDQGPYRFRSTGDRDVRSLSSVHSRSALRVGGVEVGAGLRFAPAAFVSLGLSARVRRVLSQNYSAQRESLSAWVDSSGTAVVAPGEDERFAGRVDRKEERTDRDDALSEWPNEVRAGMALLGGKVATWSADVIHHSAAEARVAGLARAAVTNVATGIEVVLLSRLILRGGAFTNFDATASRDVFSAQSRGEHIDYLGTSSGMAFRFKSSEYGAVYVHQWGRGKAEKAPGVESAVSSRYQLLTLTASQSF
jgi:long-chain fatty acid transport protein